MTIQEFIEKAIEGGWAPKDAYRVDGKAQFVQLLVDGYIKYQQHKEGEPNVPIDNDYISVDAVLLDPLAWKAIGKVSKWGTEMVMIDEPGHPEEWCYFDHCSACGATILDQEDGCPEGCAIDDAYIPEWHYNMRRMIDALADGKTIEEFIGTL